MNQFIIPFISILQIEYENLKAERSSSRMGSNMNMQANYMNHHINTSSHGNILSDSELESTPISTPPSKEEAMLAEARLLRQHKGRLETRMQILEDHNSQLESQLQRLRQLLESEPLPLSIPLDPSLGDHSSLGRSHSALPRHSMNSINSNSLTHSIGLRGNMTVNGTPTHRNVLNNHGMNSANTTTASYNHHGSNGAEYAGEKHIEHHEFSY
jgi:hypothetical protein